MTKGTWLKVGLFSVGWVFFPQPCTGGHGFPPPPVDGGLKTTVAIKLGKGAKPTVCSLIPKVTFCLY